MSEAWKDLSEGHLLAEKWSEMSEAWKDLSEGHLLAEKWVVMSQDSLKCMISDSIIFVGVAC